MSLEAAIHELNTNVAVLIDLMRGQRPMTATEVLDRQTPGTPIPAVQPVKEEPAKVDAPKEEAPAMKYEDLVPIAQALAKAKGREALVTVLKASGLPDLKSAKPDQFAKLAEAMKEATK